MNLNISEIFYSLQGEGARAGTPTFFIRLQGCSVKYACLKSGVLCDTEFESGKSYSLDEILSYIQNLSPECKEITWTGGEPTDQLTFEIVDWFKQKGYYQAIETSGLKPCPDNLDFICVSPKVAEHVLIKNFTNEIDEIKYVRHKGQEIPQTKIKAKHYWISPHSNGFTIDSENLNHCIKLCKENPKWKISIQQHKIWNIL